MRMNLPPRCQRNVGSKRIWCAKLKRGLEVVILLLSAAGCGIVPDRNVKPIASFTFKLPDPQTRRPGEWIVGFDASGSYDPDGPGGPSAATTPPASYIWDFGDGGSPVTVLSPTTTKPFNVDSGTFVVSLTVVDDDGDRSEPFSQQVKLRPNRPPIARFSATVESSGPARVAKFDASQSSDPDSTESQPFLTYKWNFGDKQTLNTLSSVVQHPYAPGDYTVSLVVFDGIDDSTAAIQGLQVR